jgi:hypothetical protein
MVVKIVDQFNEDAEIERLWQLYSEVFADLNALAVQRHLMYRSEFEDVMRDSRIQKYLSLDDHGSVCGLSTYTNELTAMPLISPAYFERRWPELYAQRKVWYCGFVAVFPSGRANHSFAELVEAMYLTAAAQNGIIGLDFCQFNDDQRRMSRVVRAMLQRLSGGVRAQCADQQSYWTYEFPNAA